jgi:hypothetical protein
LAAAKGITQGAEEMNNHSTQIVQKLWNYCNVLRDDGMSYGDYLSAGLGKDPSAKFRIQLGVIDVLAIPQNGR